MRRGQVVAVHPERRTVDVVMLDDKSRFAEVDVATPDGSWDGGSWHVPDVPPPSSEKAAGGIQAGQRNLVALVDFEDGRPTIAGFIHPNGGQVIFKQQNRSIQRHPSGAYTTTAPDGSLEMWHPSGTTFRIGTGGHEDLAPLAADGNWSVPAGAAIPTITLQTPAFSLVVAPSGDAVMTYKTLTLNGPVQLNGPLVATGNGTFAGIDVDGHVHGGVQRGSSTTNGPQG